MFNLLKMNDVVIRYFKFIFNKAIVLFTSRAVITKLDDESKVIFSKTRNLFQETYTSKRRFSLLIRLLFELRTKAILLNYRV